MAKTKSLTDLAGYRGKDAMEEEAALALSQRVAIALIRGSIDHAREALEDGWRDHLEQTADLPIGSSLLDVPLARVMGDDPRNLNTLERLGILTVGDLIRESLATGFYGIPNMGPATIAKLSELAVSMRERAA
jgi:hypothetical protein